MADNNSGRDAVVTTGGWFLFMILMAIPVVNVIVIIVEAFGSGSNRNKQGYCRALILWFILGLIGSVLCFGLFWGSLKALSDNFDIDVDSDPTVTKILQTLENGDTILLHEKNSAGDAETAEKLGN